MKKLTIVALLAFSARLASADTITNYVYVVSNIFNQVFTENVITQKIKSSHTNYYFTNYVSTVSNVFLTTFQTNLSVTADVSLQFVEAASNEANRAESAVGNAQAYSSQANSYKNEASGFKDQASGYATQAEQWANYVETFAGQMITNVNVNVSTVTNIDVKRREIDVTYNADHSLSEPVVYTNSLSGNVWDNITVHPWRIDGGATVSRYGTDSYAGICIRVWPNQRADAGRWEFYPAFIDSDTKGMRLQYVPNEPTEIPYSDTAGAYPGGKIVPEYLYWQDGYLYFKANVWTNSAVAGYCISRAVFTTYPRPINYGTSTGSAISAIDRYRYGQSTSSTYTGAWFNTLTRESGSFEFPQNLSQSLWSTLEWMKHGPW